MKKSKLKYLSGILLVGLALVTTGCDKGDTPNISNDEIKDVYNTYVANGGTLSYEDWLNSIKGEKGEKGDKGDQGPKGESGSNGKSAYDLAVEAGFSGTVDEWLASLNSKYSFKVTDDAIIYNDGSGWKELIKLSDIVNKVFDKASSETEEYEIYYKVEGSKVYMSDDNETWYEWLDLSSIAGDGSKEVELSANDSNIIWRYKGDTTWNDLVSLTLLKGNTGASAYEMAVAAGFEGTETEWLVSLHGASAFDIYMKYHPEYEGTEEEWVNSFIDNRVAHTVTYYDYNGDVCKTESIKHGELATNVSMDDLYGYKFNCWEDEEGDKWTFKQSPVLDDINLYACYSECSLLYEIGTDSGIHVNVTTINSEYNATNVWEYMKELPLGENVSITAVVGSGTEFKGWYNKNEKISSELTLTIDYVNEGLELQARTSSSVKELKYSWVEDYNKTYSYTEEYVIGYKPTALDSIECENGEFAGWYYGDIQISDENGKIINTNKYNEVNELTAKINYYSVKFVVGNTAVKEVEVSEDTPFNINDIPVIMNNQYGVRTWYSDVTLSNLYDTSTLSGATSGIYLYGKTESTNTITYKIDGETVKTQYAFTGSVAAPYDYEVEDGYTLVGWYESNIEDYYRNTKFDFDNAITSNIELFGVVCETALKDYYQDCILYYESFDNEMNIPLNAGTEKITYGNVYGLTYFGGGNSKNNVVVKDGYAELIDESDVSTQFVVDLGNYYNYGTLYITTTVTPISPNTSWTFLTLLGYSKNKSRSEVFGVVTDSSTKIGYRTDGGVTKASTTLAFEEGKEYTIALKVRMTDHKVDLMVSNGETNGTVIVNGIDADISSVLALTFASSVTGSKRLKIDDLMVSFKEATYEESYTYALGELNSYYNSLNSSDYTQANWQSMMSNYLDCKTALGDVDERYSVITIYNDFMGCMEGIPTILETAKETAISDILSYKNSKNITDDALASEAQNTINIYEAKINNSTSVSEVTSVTNEFKTEIDFICCETKYEMSFIAYDSVGNMINVSINSIKVANGFTAKLDGISVDGYEVAGFYTDTNRTVVYDKANTSFTKDVVLYVVLNEIITFNVSTYSSTNIIPSMFSLNNTTIGSNKKKYTEGDTQISFTQAIKLDSYNNNGSISFNITKPGCLYIYYRDASSTSDAVYVITKGENKKFYGGDGVTNADSVVRRDCIYFDENGIYTISVITTCTIDIYMLEFIEGAGPTNTKALNADFEALNVGDTVYAIAKAENVLINYDSNYKISDYSFMDDFSIGTIYFIGTSFNYSFTGDLILEIVGTKTSDYQVSINSAKVICYFW